ncbi:MAG: hypothetical protein IH986_12435 [Planctomycetes bacterium]|nr:hypothetical protein [Planctomycetota bacterium]
MGIRCCVPIRTLRRTPGLAAGAFAVVCAFAVSADETRRIVCPVSADTSIVASRRGGRIVNLGGAEKIFAQGNRHYLALKFDTAKLAGMKVTRATLRLRRVETLLVRVGVSTIASDWVEGTSKEPRAEPGSACYDLAAYQPDPSQARWWAGAGSDFSDVVFGGGGSRWAQRVAKFDKDSMWYEIDVPPAFVQALALGLQPGGLCVSDDFGRHDTLPTVWSRESESPPELVVEAVPVEPTAAAPPADVRTHRDALGMEWVSFTAPQALGYEIYLTNRLITNESELSGARRLDTWAMPAPGAGTRIAVLSLYPVHAHTHVAVRAVESTGMWSPFASAKLPDAAPVPAALEAPTLPRYDLPTTMSRSFTMDEGPSLSLDGKWIRNAGQTWWRPFKGPVTLQAGRSEFVSFQVILAGGPGTYRVTMADWKSPGLAQPAPRVRTYRQHYVQIPLGKEKYAPDAMIPLDLGEEMLLELMTPEAAAQPTSQPIKKPLVQGVWVELYVPRNTARGVWRSRVVALRNGVAELDIRVELEIVDATLPDALTFKVSLGASAPPSAALELQETATAAWEALNQYHRLAHEHRATLAIMPYTQVGEMHAGFAPSLRQEGDALRIDWEDWDRRFGRYLDGSAFRDLPREAVPLDHFVLPFFEGWPMPFRARRAPAGAPLAVKYHYRTTKTEVSPRIQPGPRPDAYMRWPVETAFDDAYAQGTREVLRRFAEHIRESPWDRTSFQLLLNNRILQAQLSRWWLMDGAEVLDDFLALRFWLSLYRDALGADGPGRILIRTAMTNPQLQRGLLDGLCDLSVLDESFYEKGRLVLTNPQRFPTVWTAGGELRPELGWSSAYRWCWAARLAGARGVVVPESLGLDKHWDRAAPRAIMYPGTRIGTPAPQPSLRLKALLRMQQDLEWLEVWLARARAAGVPEGYALASVGRELALRSKARTPPWAPLLPVLQFPPRMDTVVFEEIRRGLRQSAAR